jgi:hypothetical protein
MSAGTAAPKRGDFLILKYTSGYAYVHGSRPSGAFDYVQVVKVRGLGRDGTVSTVILPYGSVERPRGEAERWLLPAAHLRDPDAFWRAIQGRNGKPFDSLDDLNAFARPHRKEPT